MLKKRVRGSNFNGKEENILIMCILRHLSTIENKKTDATALREKHRAWEEIGNEFNSLCPDVTRHTKALKDKYTNIKTMLRKEFAAEKMSRKSTSDGNEFQDWPAPELRPRSQAMTELVNFLTSSSKNKSPNLDYDDDGYDYESHDTVMPSVESFTIESDDDDEKPFESINLETIEIPHNDNSDSVKNVTMDNIFPTNLSQSSTNKSWSTSYIPIHQHRSWFNAEEENILAKCVLRHASVVESRKTDASALREKHRVWEKIGIEFNSLCPNVPRQTKALRDKYINLKTMLRNEFDAQKLRHQTTDSGKEWRPKSKAMAELAKLLSYSFSASPLASKYDDEDGDDYEYESHHAVLPCVQSFTVESDDGEKSFELNNHQTIEVLQSDKRERDTNKNCTNLSQPSSNKPFSKYHTSIHQKSNRSQLKPMPSVASPSHSDVEVTLQSLKKKLVKRTLEMREIEHQTRLDQHKREHEARLALLEAQKMDFDTKIKLRQLKIAKITNEKNIKTEEDFE